MQQCIQLSRLMRMSWELQRRKSYTRSKALQAAWAICQNEDITIYYLVKRHSHAHGKGSIKTNNLSLFQQH